MKTQWLKFHSSQVCFNCKSQFVYATDKHDCNAKNVSDSKIVCKDCWYKLATGSMTWASMYGN